LFVGFEFSHGLYGFVLETRVQLGKQLFTQLEVFILQTEHQLQKGLADPHAVQLGGGLVELNQMVCAKAHDFEFVVPLVFDCHQGHFVFGHVEQEFVGLTVELKQGLLHEHTGGNLRVENGNDFEDPLGQRLKVALGQLGIDDVVIHEHDEGLAVRAQRE